MMLDKGPSDSGEPTRHGRGCWYRIDIWECVLCGRTRQDRERQWGPRPDDPAERIHYTQGSCGVHFT
jgi:hypothetical protein